MTNASKWHRPPRARDFLGVPAEHYTDNPERCRPISLESRKWRRAPDSHRTDSGNSRIWGPADELSGKFQIPLCTASAGKADRGESVPPRLHPVRLGTARSHTSEPHRESSGAWREVERGRTNKPLVTYLQRPSRSESSRHFSSAKGGRHARA